MFLQSFYFGLGLAAAFIAVPLKLIGLAQVIGNFSLWRAWHIGDDVTVDIRRWMERHALNKVVPKKTEQPFEDRSIR
jgi:hypothetical protein